MHNLGVVVVAGCLTSFSCEDRYRLPKENATSHLRVARHSRYVTPSGMGTFTLADWQRESHLDPHVSHAHVPNSSGSLVRGPFSLVGIIRG